MFIVVNCEDYSEFSLFPINSLAPVLAVYAQIDLKHLSVPTCNYIKIVLLSKISVVTIDHCTCEVVALRTSIGNLLEATFWSCDVVSILHIGPLNNFTNFVPKMENIDVNHWR